MDYHVCSDGGEWSSVSHFQLHDLECIGKFIAAWSQFESRWSPSFFAPGVEFVSNFSFISMCTVFDGPGPSS